MAMLVALYTMRSITTPMRAAVALARRMAQGDLCSRIEVSTDDETGQLLAALRDMNDSLVTTVGKVRHGTLAIQHAADQIANAELSARTEAQASALAQTASAMAVMTDKVRLNSDSATMAERMAASARTMATDGGAGVRQVVAIMASIKNSSRRIVDIIEVIDCIALQTKILALNAAVEAARAGEHGRGFAVVAREVQTLGQHSSSAAQEIKQLISESVGGIEIGGRLVDAAGANMANMITAVEDLHFIIGQISTASQQQRAGIEDINLTIGETDEMTQSNAAPVVQAASAAASMAQRASQLSLAVAVFTLEDRDHQQPLPFVFKRMK